jgi:RNA polymerase sigma-70 factor, ECF subfamily
MPFDPSSGEHDLEAVLTLEVLFRSEMDFVMNTARRCGLSDADAEDVAQQVFLALQRRLHTLQSPESVRPWLLLATRRRALAHRGNFDPAAGEPAADEIGEIEDDTPAAEEMLLRCERSRVLLDLLEGVEPGRRAVLIMRVLDEASMTEIALSLGIPVTTAYNRLRLARRDLRDAFERKQMSEEHGFLLRSWQNVLKVRDPFECFYGRGVITQAVRDRLWATILEGLVRTHGSLEQAEAAGLRVLSPIWRQASAPRPYRRLKQPPRFARSERVALPPLRPSSDPARSAS